MENCYLSAVQEAPLLGRPWFKLASWCYRQGRELLDRSREGKPTEVLTAPELLQLDGILSTAGLTNPKQLIEDLYAVFRRMILDDGGQEEESLTMKHQVQAVIPNSPSVVEDVLELFEKIRDRLLSLYSRAIDGYFRFLAVGFDSPRFVSFPFSPCFASSKNKNVKYCSLFPSCEFSTQLADSYDHDSEDCNITTASLKILRILVKYGVHLQKSLSNGIEKSPARSWQGIVPQLFARLSHPEAFVCKKLAEIICKVCEVSAASVAYPVVVALGNYTFLFPSFSR